MKLRISLYIVAAALMGAHFLRASNLAVATLCLVTPLMFFFRRRWSLLLLQFMAYCAAATWIVAAIDLVESRQSSGSPWHLAAVILGTVAAFTFIAGLLLNSRAIRECYPD